MSQIIPLFTTDYSVGKSILTLEEASEIKEDEPISITSIAKKYKINPAFVVESSMTGFVKAYKHFKELDIQFIFGLMLVMVDDIKQKNEESFETENKVIVLLNNQDGYSDLIKIFSVAATEGKYYVPRLDWKNLKKFWTKNLSLAIPMYDSFLANNMLRVASCIPDFPEEPVFFMENHDLPVDGLINAAIIKYCSTNKNEIVPTHSIYYFKNADVLPYQIYRCIDRRSKKSVFSKPNMSGFGSDRFSFESYLELANRKI